MAETSEPNSRERWRERRAPIQRPTTDTDSDDFFSSTKHSRTDLYQSPQVVLDRSFRLVQCPSRQGPLTVNPALFNFLARYFISKGLPVKPWINNTECFPPGRSIWWSGMRGDLRFLTLAEDPAKKFNYTIFHNPGLFGSKIKVNNKYCQSP